MKDYLNAEKLKYENYFLKQIITLVFETNSSWIWFQKGWFNICLQVAALSPAAMNYEETLSTLRYADR